MNWYECIVLEVPLRNLLTSIYNFVPCDWVVQRAHFSEKLQNIFEIGLRKCELIVQKSLLKKKYFEVKNSETRFCCLYAKLATVKI